MDCFPAASSTPTWLLPAYQAASFVEWQRCSSSDLERSQPWCWSVPAERYSASRLAATCFAWPPGVSCSPDSSRSAEGPTSSDSPISKHRPSARTVTLPKRSQVARLADHKVQPDDRVTVLKQ